MKTTPTKSVLNHKNGTSEGVTALAASLERSCPKLTLAQYKKMALRADAYMELSTDPEWRSRWFIVQCRILQAMCHPVIFNRS